MSTHSQDAREGHDQEIDPDRAADDKAERQEFEELAKVAHRRAAEPAWGTPGRPVPPRAGRSDLSLLSGGLVVVVGIWLIIGPWVLHYPPSSQGINDQGRDVFVGIVFVLMGIWMAGSRRVDRPAVIVTVIAAVALLLGASIAPASLGRAQGLEFVCASLGLVAAVVHWIAGRPQRPTSRIVV